MKKNFRFYRMMLSGCLLAGFIFAGSGMVSAAGMGGNQAPEVRRTMPALRMPGQTAVPEQEAELTVVSESISGSAAVLEREAELTVVPESTSGSAAVLEREAEPTAAPEQMPELTAAPEQTPEPTVMPEQTPEPTRMPEPTLAPTQTPEPTAAPAQTPKPTKASKKRGWVTYANGQKRYFNKKGEYVTGFKTIDGKRYYFGPKGILHPNCWITVGDKTYRTGKEGYVLQGKLVTIKKKVYYFMNNGVMKVGWKIDDAGKMYFLADGTRATGLTKVGERYYYFDSKGQMKTGTFTVGENTYYMSDSGILQAWKSKTAYYDSSNNKMSSLQAEDFETLQRAKAVLAQITTPSMSNSQKLKKCFDWVISKPYATRRKFTNFAGWPAVYANDHFIYGSGNCQSDAAAFAYLAKAIGYTDVYVCADSTGWGLPHSWAQVDGLYYDPLFAEAKSYSRYYAARTHPLTAIVHLKL